MAKPVHDDKSVVREGKTPWGSHKEMIVETSTNELGNFKERFVVCKDHTGEYITERKNLDNGCADPYRYASSEYKSNLKSLFQRFKEKQS